MLSFLSFLHLLFIGCRSEVVLCFLLSVVVCVCVCVCVFFFFFFFFRCFLIHAFDFCCSVSDVWFCICRLFSLAFCFSSYFHSVTTLCCVSVFYRKASAGVQVVRLAGRVSAFACILSLDPAFLPYCLLQRLQGSSPCASIAVLLTVHKDCTGFHGNSGPVQVRVLGVHLLSNISCAACQELTQVPMPCQSTLI